MTNLKDQVREFVKFDEQRSYNAAPSMVTGPGGCVAHDQFIYGARWRHSRLSPLLEILPDVVEALESSLIPTEIVISAKSNNLIISESQMEQLIKFFDLSKQTLAKIKEAVGGK